MSRGRRRQTVIVPPPCPGVDQVTSVTALGIQLNDRLTVTDHYQLPVVVLCSPDVCVASIAQGDHLVAELKPEHFL